MTLIKRDKRGKKLEYMEFNPNVRFKLKIQEKEKDAILMKGTPVTMLHSREYCPFLLFDEIKLWK